MKNQYVKPLLEVEEFLANSYCSNCGKTVDGDYLFECTFSAGTLYLETNGLPGRQTDETRELTCTRWHIHNNNCYKTIPKDQKIGSFSPCKKTHKTSTMADFVDGYVGTTPVTVWVEGTKNADGTWNWSNAHATDHVPQEHWTTEKS